MLFNERSLIEHKLFILLITILNNGGEMDALFLDYSKAKVSHARLIQKLEHHRICPQLVHWIKDLGYRLWSLLCGLEWHIQ